jgi:hypothetical protein
MKKIAKLLKADLNGTSDLAAIASMLSSKGRGNDTLLAHITPREAEILKAAGGSGTTNPETGLLEFYEYEQEAGQFDPGGFYGNEAAQYEPVSMSGEVIETGQGIQVAAPAADRFSAQGTGSTLPPEIRAEPVFSGATTSYISPYGTGLQPVSLTGRDYSVTPAAATGAPALAAEGRVARTVDTPADKSFFDKLSTQDMVRLGLAGGLGIYGATQAKRGAKQAEQAAAQQRAVAEPYQAKGRELIRAAETGELTPTGQQSLQALQARLAQGAEARGGVGTAQAAAQAEAYRQQLLAQQYDLGLKVSNIGDNIALGAIKTGIQADQALSQASTNFYTNLAAIGAGIPMARTT